MANERFMRHHYGASGFLQSADAVAFDELGKKLARVQLMCTEGFCNVSMEDKAAIREVYHLLIDRTALMHRLENLVSDLEKERARLSEAKRAEQAENTRLRETPPELDRIVDVVLAYRPKPKSKAAKKRAKKAAKAKKAQDVDS